MATTTREDFPRDTSGAPVCGVVDDSTGYPMSVKGDETLRSQHVTLHVWDTDLLEWVKWDGKSEVTFEGDITVGVETLEGYILDQLWHYKLSDWLVSGDKIYTGYLDKSGAWYIKEIDVATGQVRYAKGTADYTFVDPAGLSYATFSATF
jgi:hypothetical protein